PPDRRRRLERDPVAISDAPTGVRDMPAQDHWPDTDLRLLGVEDALQLVRDGALDLGRYRRFRAAKPRRLPEPPPLGRDLVLAPTPSIDTREQVSGFDADRTGDVGDAAPLMAMQQHHAVRAL